MANLLKGSKFFVCVTPQSSDLDATAFGLLTYVQVGGVMSLGERGLVPSQQVFTPLDATISLKQKGVANAGDPPLKVARDYADAGQTALIACGKTDFYYAFKYEYADMPSGGSSNTLEYMRGNVAGPVHDGGANEDYDMDTCILGLVQESVMVNAT